MNQTGKRHGVLTFRTLGRGFWIGIAASLALHALLVTTGRFQMQRWEDATTLEVRIEPKEFEAVSLRKPEPVDKPAAKPQTETQTQPQQQPVANPPTPIAAPPVQPPTPATAVNEPAPVPPKALPEYSIPHSPAGPVPPVDKPYAALTGAAENIRKLPSNIEITYELQGMLSGRQIHHWRIRNDRYSLESESEASGLAGLFVRGKMIQKSEGRLSTLGLMPEQYENQRSSGKREILRFDYKANLIESIRIDSRNGQRTLDLPLIIGTQDPLSSVYQLAMAAQSDKDGLLVAASIKRVKGYPYRTLGMETLKTPLGEISTVHVARAGESEKGAVHLWLAPQHNFLPVKVTYIDEDGTDWVLEAVSIKTE